MKFNYFHWAKVLDKDEIKKVVNICESNVDSLGDLRYPPKHGEELTSKTAKVTCTQWKYLSKILGGLLLNWEIINQYEFGYNLYPILERALLNYNVYDSSNSGEYDFHIDASLNEVSDIKLTAMINLSEEYYEGGDFILFHAGKFRKISPSLFSWLSSPPRNGCRTLRND